MEQFYRAIITTADFSNAAQTAYLINQWVNKQTRGLIPDIVTPGLFLLRFSLFT